MVYFKLYTLYVSVWGKKHIWVPMPTGSREDIGSPGAGIPGDCEPPDNVQLEIELGSSIRAVIRGSKYWTISVAPNRL